MNTINPNPITMEPIDYDRVARLYDVYASTDYDFRFFTQQIRTPGMRVLELTSGTGRLSIPLIEAGADLTCVDFSGEMLEVLAEKLLQRNVSAPLVCADICDINFESDFKLAILPFQSFMELVGNEKQRRALAAVFRALEPGGQFICTLYNPTIRRQAVDGILRIVGQFPMDDGTLVVSGFEQGGQPVVMRHQFFEYFDAAGTLVWKRLLPMSFEFIERAAFQDMVEAVGFRVLALYGNYDRSPFDKAQSPVMIWVLQKD